MKKQTAIALTLTLLALISIAQAQTCSLSSTTSDLLQSGQNILYNAYTNSPTRRQHKYQFNLNFQVPAGRSLQIAASASNFAVSASSGMDFAIWGGPGPSTGTGLIVLLLNENNAWTSVRVSFLASARSDFFLGAFSASTYFPQVTSPNGVISYSYGIPNWSSSSSSYTVIVQIAGLRTAASSFIAALTTVSFQGGVITFQASLSASPPIEELVIAYLVFSNSSPIQFSHINVNSGSSLPYQFYGLDRVESGSSTVVAYGFSSATQSGVSCVGSRCPATCITSQMCLSYSGTLSGTTCYLCASGQVVSNGACVTPSTNCGANQYYNGTNCVCIPNYVMVGGVCYYSCGVNAVVMNSQCQCLPGYTFSNVYNQCRETTTIQCGTNFVVSNGVCVCPSPYGRINNLCTTCPSNSYINNQGYCTCLPGYTMNPNTLKCGLTCWTNAYRNDLGQCVCIDGYYNQGNTCVPQGTCNNGLVWNGTACVCPSGMVMDSITNQCTYCNTVGHEVVNGACVCSSNYYPTNTGCSPCPAHSHYNATQGSCTCDTNYTISNGQCVAITYCPFDSFWNATAQRCQCNTPGQYVIDGYCQVCPPYSYWNGSSCVCNAGYYLSGSSCVKTCVNGTWNGVTCVCWSGYYVISGVCKLCDANSHYSNTQFTCICNDGYFGTWNQCSVCDSSCATCSGPGYNQCTACKVGYSLNNGYCTATCSAGTFLNSTNQCQACHTSCATCSGAASNQCASCPTGSNLSNGICVPICSAGTFLNSTNQCQACHTSCATCSGAASNQCTSCPTGSNLSNGICVPICSAGTFLNSTNQCQACHTSCVNCSGAANNQCTACPSGTTLTNGVCVPTCTSGQFLNSSNQCQPCLANCAVCSTATTCTQCATGYTPNNANNAGTVITSCSQNPSGATSKITLRESVLGNKVIYQGLSMSLMPTAIIATSCGICSTLFQIDINSQFSGITTTQTFIANTQYWFVITFNFPTATFVPTFEFTVRINPTHATYFTSEDMAQVLRGAFNQNSFATTTTFISAATVPATPSLTINRSSGLGSGMSTTTSTFNPVLLQQLFK